LRRIAKNGEDDANQEGSIMGLSNYRTARFTGHQAESRNGNGEIIMMNALLEAIRGAVREGVQEALIELSTAKAEENPHCAECDRGVGGWIESVWNALRNRVTKYTN
jgi:hypothetical protein